MCRVVVARSTLTPNRLIAVVLSMRGYLEKKKRTHPQGLHTINARCGDRIDWRWIRKRWATREDLTSERSGPITSDLRFEVGLIRSRDTEQSIQAQSS